ncbi:MAG: beta strand repeat-containing protein, partial [Sphingosinicella sp.]|uniref:beta strand repeat-containing protein n=1 Tax=Sphingosinicella sp. TaxID=1917971 RepID=UPI004037C91F
MMGNGLRSLRLVALAGASLAALMTAPALAQDSTWSANPENVVFGGRSDYQRPGNWVEGVVPTGTATFGLTSETDIFFENQVNQQPITIGRFVFTANAPAYTFTLQSDEFTFLGEGIVNNSSATQSFIVGNRSTLRFANNSSAGNAALLGEGSQGRISFENNSNAGTAQITIGGSGFGRLEFRDNSSAANAAISNPFGNIIFSGSSTAANARITNLSGTTFNSASSLGNALITNRTGLRIFNDASGAGATIVNETGGLVDISQVDGGAASTAIGSLSGVGNVALGGRNLTLGALNRDDIISGVISDGGDLGGTGGSLTKVGTGTLTLSGASTYTGATTVNGGTLLLTGSITGAGATSVGSGSGTNGRLTIQGGGRLNSGGNAVIGEAGGAGDVRVTGAGSIWTIGGSLRFAVPGALFQGNTAGTLTIENGGAVTSASTNIEQAQGRSSSASVSGAGSTWNMGALSLTGASSQPALTVQSGATATSSSAFVNGRMLVTGAGTTWNSGDLLMSSPSAITSSRLSIADGATVNSAAAFIGSDAPASQITPGANAVVEVNAATWNLTGDLSIGLVQGSNSGVIIRDGATVNVAGGNGTIFIGAPGSGSPNLTIGGAATAAPGTLNAANVELGPTGQLRFLHNATGYLFAPTIAGSGLVDVMLGTTILTGDSSAFAGTTTIGEVISLLGRGGILQIGTYAVSGGGVGLGSGGATGALGGNIVNNNQLIFARSGALAIDGVISGTGTVTQTGPSNATTTLSATNTYTGATIVNGGTLLVNGSIASSSGVTVNGGGTLGGTGTVASTGGTGTINPGTAGGIGTLTIAGNLTWDSGSYIADVAPASADRIQVTGNALLGGRLVAAASGGAYAPGQSTLMTMGGRAGTFSVFTLAGNFGGLFATLSYTPTSVVLNLSQFNATDEERWLAAPATNLWNTGSNWNPDAVPIGTARFGPSTRTTLVFSPGTTQVGRLLFDADAPAYTFNLDSRIISQGGGSGLNILGQGIVNNSAFRPVIYVTVANTVAGGGAALNFFNSSTAGNAAITSFNTGDVSRAATNFYQTSSAGTAVIDNVGSGTAFHESSTAASATINNGPNGFTGSAVFFDTSTAGNATINNTADVGGVTFFDSSTAGNARILNRSVSTFSFGRPGVVGLGGVVFSDAANAGSASITNESGGNTAFVATSTAANATIVNSGAANFSYSTLFGDSSSAGSAAITNNQGGVTLFQQLATAGTATITNNQGGSTQFFQTGSAGTPTITNNDGGAVRFRLTAQGNDVTIVNNAGGILDISEDPQQTPSLVAASVAIGRLSGAGNVFLGARNLDLLGLGGDMTISGVIADGGEFGGAGGSLTWAGAGTLTLSAANTYTGATIINGGTLLVTGAIAGSTVTVNGGATLGGTGTVGATSIADGGTLAPGTSIGTLSNAGNLSFAANGNFLVEVAAASADRVNVSGSATLAGTLTALGLGGTFSAGTRYTLLTAANGLTGTFGSLVTQGDFGGLTPTLSYDGNNVILTVGRSGPTNTATTTFTDAIVFNAPTITVQRVGLFETRIVGRLAGGVALFDQVFNDAFGSATVLNGLVAARAAITAGGGPGIVIISDPVLVSRTVTSTTSSASVFGLAGSSDTVTTVLTFGPATIAIGDGRSCEAAIGALPSGTRPACGPPGTTQFTVEPGTININTITRTEYAVNETRTDTITETTSETYELTGTIAAIGTVHAAVQSGLYDLASRFLTRIGGEGAPGLFGAPGTPASDGVSWLAPSGGGGSAWAETYGFRNRADARGGGAGERRGAAGRAGGFSRSR